MKNLTAALYNTPVMIQGYYHAEVNHTMPEYAELEQCRNELGFKLQFVSNLIVIENEMRKGEI
ncbi:MAG: hypothetical protein ACLUJ1_14585 [Mediterraneibacter faecis]